MKPKSFLVGLMAVFLTLLPISGAFAKRLIDEDTLYYYGLNGIYHYNGSLDEERCTTSDGGNQNYAGGEVWSAAELAAISENQSIYEEAANEYGFPWQVLAVFHSMETALRRYNPENGQGVYQLYSYTSGGINGNSFTPGAVDETEFRRQTKLAAGIISSSVGDLNDSDNVKKLFFKFNGMSSKYIEKALAMGYSLEEAQNGEGSPYVMNRYDAKRDPGSTEMDSTWAGRYVRDGVYDGDSTSMRYGAFVKYEALAGSTNCEDMGGSIVDTARLLAWEGHGHNKNDPKPEYVEAMKKVGTYGSPCRNSSDCAPSGASCDVFVSTVMRYSGSDPDFPATGPVVQKNYMESHTDKYMKVNATDVSDLQAGDILVATDNGRHIYIYLGDGMQASASYNDRTGEMFKGVYLSDNGGTRHYEVFRRTQ